jgi:hypothetical protein
MGGVSGGHPSVVAGSRAPAGCVGFIRLTRRQAKRGTVMVARIACPAGWHRVSVRVPAGAKDRQRLRLDRWTLPERSTWPSGDLLVLARVTSRWLVLNALLGVIPVAALLIGFPPFIVGLSCVAWLFMALAGLRGPRLLLNALMAIVVSSGLMADSGTFMFALAGLWVVIGGCVSYTARRDWIRAGGWLGPSGARKTGSVVLERLRYNLCAVGILYLVPVAIAVGFYVLLSAYVGVSAHRVDLDRLRALQRGIERVSAFFSRLQLSEVDILIILVASYLLSCMLLAQTRPVAAPPSAGRRLRLRLVRGLSRLIGGYGKYTNPLGAGLAVLASLTLFGVHSGVLSDDLQLRIKTTQQSYAEVAGRTHAILSQQVAGTLYGKIRQSFPPEYRAALTLPPRIDELVTDTRQYADAVRAAYGVSDPTVDRTVRAEEARMARVARLKSVWAVANAAGVNPGGDVTSKQVDAARQAVDRHEDDSGVELVSEGEKRIFLQLPKIASEGLLELLKPVVEAMPLTGPVLQAFSEAIDETSQEHLGEVYDRTVREVLDNPDDLAGITRREAQGIVSGIDVTRPVARARASAARAAAASRRVLSTVRASIPRLDGRISAKLISELISSDIDMQTAAANQLINLRNADIEKRVISQLLSIMTSGQPPAKVNAARVIGEIGQYESPYISDEQVRQAKSICGCH